MITREAFAARSHAFAPVRDGFVEASSGERPIFEFVPQLVAQDLSVANLIAKTGATPTAAYLGNGTDTIGAVDLTPAGTALEDQASRLFSDTAGAEHPAMEFPSGGAKASAASSASFDLGVNPAFAALLVCRVPRVSTANYDLIGKYSTGTSSGWVLYRNLAGDKWEFFAKPVGETQVTPNVTGSAMEDGGLHFILVGHNGTTKTARIYTDKSESSASTAAWTASLSNTEVFEIGDVFTGSGHIGLQVAAAYYFEGSEAETLLTNRALLRSAWWTHGTDSTGKLTTYTRTGSQYATGKPDASGATLYPWGTGASAQKAIGWDAHGAGGFRLEQQQTVTNLNAYPECDATNWASDGTPTMAYLDRDNALGYHRATKITATALNDLRKRTFTASAGQRYVAMSCVEWDGTGSAPEIVVYSATDGTIARTAASVHSTPGERQWLYLAWTATAAETQNYGVSPTEYGVGTSGYCWFDHTQYEAVAAGVNEPSAFVPTSGATATGNKVVAKVTLPSPILQSEMRMETVASHTRHHTGVRRCHAMVSSLPGRLTRVWSIVFTDERGEALLRVPSGSYPSAYTAVIADTRPAATYLVQCSADATPEVKITVGASSGTVSDTLNTTPDMDELTIGDDYAGTMTMGGGVHSVKIYAKSKL